MVIIEEENKNNSFTKNEDGFKKTKKSRFGPSFKARKAFKAGGDKFRKIFLSKEIEKRRRTKVTKGGRRFTISSLVLVKNIENNSIGYGYAKGREPIIAFRKSMRSAKKKSIEYFSNKIRTIPRDIVSHYKSVRILIKPAPLGSGIKAGGALREIFELLGISDVSAKIISKSKNKNSIVRAVFMALDKLTGKKYDY